MLFPILFNKGLLSQSEGGEKSNTNSDTNVAVTTLVSDDTSDAGRLPCPNSNELQNTPVSNTGNSPSHTEQHFISSRVEALGLSPQVKELLLGSWKSGTKSSYDSAWKKWDSWCVSRQVNPFSAPLATVLDFLAWMLHQGFQYRTINVHRSAISSVLPYIEGIPVGQNPLVKQLFCGILQKNPPLPKYQFAWDLDLVLKFLSKQPANKNL